MEVKEKSRYRRSTKLPFKSGNSDIFCIQTMTMSTRILILATNHVILFWSSNILVLDIRVVVEWFANRLAHTNPHRDIKAISMKC